MATDGGLAGITLIIEPPSPPLLLCHLSSASNVILTPGFGHDKPSSDWCSEGSRPQPCCNAPHKRRNDRNSPPDCGDFWFEKKRLSTWTCIWTTHDCSKTIKRDLPLQTARSRRHLLRVLSWHGLIQTAFSHADPNAHLYLWAEVRTVPVIGRSGWRWFKWVRTILSEAAERSICMKKTVASNSWVHLFTSLQTWGVWAAAAAIVRNASLIISMFRVITSLGECSNQQSISFSFWKCSCCSCVFFNLSRLHGSCSNN